MSREENIQKSFDEFNDTITLSASKKENLRKG